MAQSGFKKILTIRKYVDNVATDFTKTNVVDTEDYFKPQYNLDDCTSDDPRAITTTTSTSTSTSTTTSAQQAVGNIAAIAITGGKVTDPESALLTRLSTNVVYVKAKEVGATMYTLVDSGSFPNAIRRNKLVIDNSSLQNLYLLQKNISGYIYSDTEGIIRDNSILSTSSTISPTDQNAAGSYLVSAVSLLDPGQYSEDLSKYLARHAPYLTLSWDSAEGRLKFKINYVELYSTGVLTTSDLLGGDTSTNDSLFSGDGKVEEVK